MFRSAPPNSAATSRQAPVLPLILGALVGISLLAITVYENEASFDPCSPQTYGPPYTGHPIPVCFSVTPLASYQNGSAWVFPFQVSYLSWGFPLAINNLSFTILNFNLSRPIPPWSVSLFDQGGKLLAQYNPVSSTWNKESSNKVAVGMTIALQAQSIPSGDVFRIYALSPNGYGVEYGFALL